MLNTIDLFVGCGGLSEGFEQSRKYKMIGAVEWEPSPVKELRNHLKNRSGRMKYTSAKSLKTLYTKLTGKTSNVHKYYVLRWDEPSNLIPAHLFKDGLRHIHPDPEQARTITVREAARLQTFPDDYYFNCSQTDAFKMIGNAVPPLFAKKVAYAIYHLIQEN